MAQTSFQSFSGKKDDMYWNSGKWAEAIVVDMGEVKGLSA